MLFNNSSWLSEKWFRIKSKLGREIKEIKLLEISRHSYVVCIVFLWFPMAGLVFAYFGQITILSWAKIYQFWSSRLMLIYPKYYAQLKIAYIPDTNSVMKEIFFCTFSNLKHVFRKKFKGKQTPKALCWQHKSSLSFICMLTNCLYRYYFNIFKGYINIDIRLFLLWTYIHVTFHVDSSSLSLAQEPTER